MRKSVLSGCIFNRIIRNCLKKEFITLFITLLWYNRVCEKMFREYQGAIENMKEIYIYKNHDGAAPAVYLNVSTGNGSDVWEECRKLRVPPVTLVVISGLAWDEELSPWAAPPVFKSDAFRGGADAYIRELVSEIVPYAEKESGSRPLWAALAGYSLAGLFAVYASCRTNLFKGFVSASGSFWYPNFAEYMEQHVPGEHLSYGYFSLGSKEHKVRNPIMATVLDRTVRVREILEKQGIRTVFETNPGNHFTEPALRVAKGIAWLLKTADG